MKGLNDVGLQQKLTLKLISDIIIFFEIPAENGLGLTYFCMIYKVIINT